MIHGIMGIHVLIYSTQGITGLHVHTLIDGGREYYILVQCVETINDLNFNLSSMVTVNEERHFSIKLWA